MPEHSLITTPAVRQQADQLCMMLLSNSVLAVQGHSLGGCLGSLLMLMFVHRKVIPPLNIGPVYTFGAPAVFAEADASVYGHQVRPSCNTVSEALLHSAAAAY